MLDPLLSDVAEAGWLFNNCYQQDNGTWRTNLRRPNGKGDWFTDWAIGETLEDALTECMNKLATAEYKEELEIKYVTEKPSDLPVKPKLNPRTLLQALGLAKPFTRRV
jgi:hypothetical protein